MSSLERRFGLLTDLTPSVYHCASNSPSIIFHSGDVSSPFPFRIGYVLVDFVTLVLFLMVVLRILSFSLTLSNLLSIARWLKLFLVSLLMLL